jgi:hypothetical protein
MVLHQRRHAVHYILPLTFQDLFPCDRPFPGYPPPDHDKHLVVDLRDDTPQSVCSKSGERASQGHEGPLRSGVESWPFS